MNAINVLDVVDQHNLTLMKMPSSEVSLLSYNSRTDKNVSDDDLVWRCIKRDVTDAVWDKLYAGQDCMQRRGNDVYRLFIRKITHRDGKLWVCFKNTQVNLSSALLMNKDFFYGDTPEDAVRAFLLANK